MNWVKSIVSKITIEHLWVITVMAGVITFLNTHPIRPHDFWWHIAIGRDMITSGSIPTEDVYSFTRNGMPYPSYFQFWLAEVVLYFIFITGGPVLTVLMQTLVITLAYTLLLWISFRVARNWRAVAFALLFAASIGFGNWNVRPQAFSYLLGAFILLGINELRITHKRVWLILFPITMTLWVNTHGSFPIGLALIAIWVASESLKAIQNWRLNREQQLKEWYLAVISLSSAVVGCAINPKGFGFTSYLTMMASNNIVQNFIPEWMQPSFTSLEGLIFFVAFMFSATLLAVSPKRPDAYQILTFLVFGLLGLRYMRGVIWYGITMAPVVADHLAALFKHIGLKQVVSPDQRSRYINAILVLAMLVMVILSLPWFKSYWPVYPEKKGLISPETPIKATQFMLDSHLPSNIFHEMAFGSYLIWNAQPDYKVFVDSRVELFPISIWDDYFTISNAKEDWEEKLKSYGINTLMLEPENQARLIEAAAQSPNWEMVYQDQAAVIFTRR
jgi:hypothetical protein